MREPATSVTSAAVGINKIQCSLATQEASRACCCQQGFGGHPCGSVGKVRERLGIFFSSQITQLLVENQNHTLNVSVVKSFFFILIR